MVVGSCNLDFKELKRNMSTPSRIVEYSDSLVPIWAKHVKGIIDNQRYFVALNIRKMTSIPYAKRKSLTNALTYNIRITGVSSAVTSISDMVDNCDKALLVELIKMELKKNDYYRT